MYEKFKIQNSHGLSSVLVSWNLRLFVNLEISNYYTLRIFCAFISSTLGKKTLKPKNKATNTKQIKKTTIKKRNGTNQQDNKYLNEIPVLALKFHNMECWKHFTCVKILLLMLKAFSTRTWLFKVHVEIIKVDVKSMNFFKTKKSYFAPGYLQPSTNTRGKLKS